MAITKVERWVTSDGREHGSYEVAIKREARVASASKATEMLQAGSSVADCLRVMYEMYAVDPILEQVTKDTDLVIAHWKHKDTPGYKVHGFKADGRIFVRHNSCSRVVSVDIAYLIRDAKYKTRNCNGEPI